MQEKNNVAVKESPANNDIAMIATSLFEKVKAIKRTHPDQSRVIDRLEKEIRDRLIAIRQQIDSFDRKEKDLVTILVINGLHRTAEEVLIH